MKNKKYQVRKKKSAAKPEFWRPVAIDSSIFNEAEFDGFGGLEELTDYEIIRPGEIEKISSQDKNEGKKVKVQKKKRKAVENSNSSEPSENLRATSETQVKQKILKRAKKRKVASTSELGESKLSAKKQKLEAKDVEKSDQENQADVSPWCNYFLPQPILLALKDLGFEKPTPIQELTLIPAIRDHRDILGAAETGSGKTLAFGIPIVTHILNMKEKERELTEDEPSENCLKALILTPTRELAIQVKNHLLMLLKYTDIKIAAVIGGLAAEKQQRILRKHPDIVVATPGRLWELMEEGNSHLGQVPNVRYLVIDEADRMVEKGHFAELIQILELINSGKENKRRQTFIFSATLTAIHELPKRMLMKKRKVKLEKRQKLESLVNLIGMKENPKIIDITKRAGVAETLAESRINCTTEEKDLYLYYFILMYPGRTLVFCNSISSVRRLKTILDLLECNPLPLHASMHQRQRLKNVERFAADNHNLLLATDVAARGLDIKGIEHVVHFQVPRTTEVYVHRSGRTARAQNEGLSLMLVDAQESAYYQKICRTLNKDQPLPEFPVDHHILKTLKERVVLSRQIDQQEHKTQKMAAQNRWFTKAAQEMDVDIEDEDLLNDLGDSQQRSQQSQQLKIMKKRLKAMLKKPVVPKSLTGRYPTKSGKLEKPPQFGAEKAYEVMKKK